MGIFGPSVDKENRGGKIQFYVKCRRCKGGGKKIYGDTEKEAKRNYADHESAHNAKVRQGAKSIKKLARRAKKEKCAFCGKNPCSMTKRQCVEKGIAEFGSSMDLDMSDPGTFDDQLKWYNENM